MAHLDWSPVVASYLFRLQKEGITLVSVDDGEEKFRLKGSKMDQRKEAVDTITSVDESWLRVSYGEEKATLFFVLGNGAEEILSDRSCPKDEKFEELLEKVENEFINYWENKKVPLEK